MLGITSKKHSTTSSTRCPKRKSQQQKANVAIFMESARIIGHHKVKPAAHGLWRMDGVKTHLRHHQVIGAGFMKQIEMHFKDSIGGIIADQMGLGKTLTALALIINTLPPANE